MSLNDREHVEAVAIIRRLMETGGGVSDPEAYAAAEGWLRENHPTTEQYLGALKSEMAKRATPGTPLHGDDG